MTAAEAPCVSGARSAVSPANRGNHSLLFNSLWRLAQVTTGSVFGAAQLLLYTMELDKADYGTYGVAMSVSFLFQLVGTFGLRQTITRFVAQARGAGDLTRVRAYIDVAIRSSVVSGLVALALYGLGTQLFAPFFTSWPGLLIVLIGAHVFGTCLSFVQQGVLEGSGLFKEVSVSNLLVNILKLVLILSWMPWGLRVTQVVAIEAFMAWVAVPLFGVQLGRAKAALGSGDSQPQVWREIVLFAVPVFLNSLGGFLYGRVDLLFLHQYLTVEETADYYLMVRLFDFPLLALGAYVFVLNTDVAHAWGQGDRPRIARLFWRSEGAGVALGLGLAVLFFGSTYVLPWLLPTYTGAMVLMRISAPLLVVKCVAQVASGAFMVSLGRPGMMALFTGVGGVLNVALDLLLIPTFRAPGAVYSTLIGHTLMGALTFWFVQREVRRLARGGAATTA